MGVPKVMVVDDDEFMREFYRKMLVGNGFDVAEAANGIEAVSVYRDFQPDVVLMDVKMPEMNATRRSSCFSSW